MPAWTTCWTTIGASDMVKLDVLVNEVAVDALSVIVHRDQAYYKGQRLVTKMKAIIPARCSTCPSRPRWATR